MVFNSALYVIFVCAVCVICYIFPRRARYVWLLLCSFAFYLFPAGAISLSGGVMDWQTFLGPDGIMKNMPAFALMLAAILVSYGCGLGIHFANKKLFKRLWLGISIFTCLGLLISCKYLKFFLSFSSIFASGASGLSIILPLGISYYTLQTISYAIDIYNGTQEAERNPLRYALYVSFFSALVTGPINRAGKMLPQYKRPAKFNYNKVAGGLFRVFWGICKKMIIADNIGLFTSAVLNGKMQAGGPEIILALLLLPYQIYADFGGCCDIAIGTAKMLGFEFSENFERPFAAKTFPLLWQRWHITLTSFFRDYIFTPLVWSRWTQKLPVVGKHLQKPPAYSSVIIIFLLSGLWHGANINYVLWGLANGIIMVLAQMFGKKKERLAKKIPVYRMRFFRGSVQRILVYLMFSACIVFFAAGMFDKSVLPWLAALGTGWQGFSAATALATAGAAKLNVYTLMALGACLLLVEGIEAFAVKPERNISVWIRDRRFFVRWPIYFILSIVLLFFGVFGASPFIYMVY